MGSSCSTNTSIAQYNRHQPQQCQPQQGPTKETALSSSCTGSSHSSFSGSFFDVLGQGAQLEKSSSLRKHEGKEHTASTNLAVVPATRSMNPLTIGPTSMRPHCGSHDEEEQQHNVELHSGRASSVFSSASDSCKSSILLFHANNRSTSTSAGWNVSKHNHEVSSSPSSHHPPASSFTFSSASGTSGRLSLCSASHVSSQCHCGGGVRLSKIPHVSDQFVSGDEISPPLSPHAPPLACKHLFLPTVFATSQPYDDDENGDATPNTIFRGLTANQLLGVGSVDGSTSSLYDHFSIHSMSALHQLQHHHPRSNKNNNDDTASFDVAGPDDTSGGCDGNSLNLGWYKVNNGGSLGNESNDAISVKMPAALQPRRNRPTQEHCQQLVSPVVSRAPEFPSHGAEECGSCSAAMTPNTLGGVVVAHSDDHVNNVLDHSGIQSDSAELSQGRLTPLCQA